MSTTFSRCDICLFCEEKTSEFVRCSNADVANELSWEATYMVQGFLDLPLAEGDGPPCFWFVAAQ